MDSFASVLETELIEKLKHFASVHTDPQAPISLESDEQQKFWSESIKLLRDANMKIWHAMALNTLRILSRNSQIISSCIDKETLRLLITNAGVDTKVDTDSTRKRRKDCDATVIGESLKCLSNIYFQCRELEAVKSMEVEIVSGIANQAKQYKEQEMALIVISFDMRLLTIITSQSQESRARLILDHDVVILMTTVLSNIIDLATKKTAGDKNVRSTNHAPASIADEATTMHTLKGEDVSATINTLNALGNCISCEDFKKDNLDEASKLNLTKLCSVLYELFMLKSETVQLKTSTNRAIIQLLAAFDHVEFTSPLFPETTHNDYQICKLQKIRYEGRFMDVAQEILDYFMATAQGFNHDQLQDNLSLVLKVLCQLSSAHRLVRKYYRKTILPPLRDLSHRPDESCSAKGYLCKFLTSPSEKISNLAGHFLFVLCKENTKRFVKHVGYGNAAGLLARRRLLAGGSNTKCDQYSEDEDSDTEEYKKQMNSINPISGRVENTNISPFEGMSEEQKEFEAVKLANEISRLQNLGLIKPAKIGEDGNPEAVSHVLELIDDGIATKNLKDPSKKSYFNNE